MNKSVRRGQLLAAQNQFLLGNENRTLDSRFVKVVQCHRKRLLENLSFWAQHKAPVSLLAVASIETIYFRIHNLPNQTAYGGRTVRCELRLET